ncbi:hypothetical protein IWX50DRAFT_242072 [Phyllosticta citricarpa]|uniref:Amidohydrolase-related domain-containing protein n=1 Tax=Phyllosticta citricarpa TaxID=55181 RepID=A0ABR1MRK9_9PEZI
MAPPPLAGPRILDSHIHLWPASAANEDGHTWMTPDAPLTRPYLLSDYLTTTHGAPIVGAVFVETDRRLTPVDDEADEATILTRCAGPLDEMAWLRSLVEHDDTGREMLWGLVPWAPFDATPAAFQRYLDAAEKTTGAAAWARVRGWRYLVQGITNEAAFRGLVGSSGWMENLRECGRRDWCFDIGVDARSGGVWQLEAVADMCEKVRQFEDAEGAGQRGQGRLTFILNHLCKPDMLQHPTTSTQLDAFNRWAACMHRFARLPRVYMKLSGGFSEMDLAPDATADQVVARLKPWLDVVFRCFTAQRIMFGSDWPVCNVRGPGGHERAWRAWRDAVELVIGDHETGLYDLSHEQRDRVWFGTAVEAYGLTPPRMRK